VAKTPNVVLFSANPSRSPSLFSSNVVRTRALLSSRSDYVLSSLHLAVYCGFDSDATGDVIAEQMIAFHPSLRRLRPSQHDWNDILKSRY
jgi:hypothetical protein